MTSSFSRMSLILLCLVGLAGMVGSSAPSAHAVSRNVTRFSGGDLFSIPGTDCGPTRCTEMSQGTALSTMGAGCMCQCQADTPAFREDQRACVNAIDECQMASFGRGATKPQIPFVFLPLKGQIIYPSKEIIFTDVEDAICVVTSAQYLSDGGWVTLRDAADNDVPFGLYRDEGKTFLQWRGSVSLHARLEGRLVAAHVLCSSQNPVRLGTSCAAFRIAGASHNALLDVSSITFHAGEAVTPDSTPSPGLSVLECLAIGVCVLLLVFVYAAGIVFYVHYKQRQRRKNKDPESSRGHPMSENGSGYDTRIDMDNIRMKTNPLLGMDSLSNDYLHDAVLSDVSEHTEDTVDSSPKNIQKFQKTNSNVISALVHTKRKKPTRPSIRAAPNSDRTIERIQRRSASPDLERAPHSDLSIIDCSVESNGMYRQDTQPSANTEPTVLRRKLYFNPVFFESEHLKNPPPAAIDFLVKIREVMTIAKDKMTSKRFVPILSDIPEEELYHTIDLGWDIPCARRGRRFSAISLKRENSRRAVHCGGCPGCDSSSAREQKITNLTRSNSCKSCVSDDFKQSNVRKWLNEVPAPKPVKSIAKVSGTPRVIEQKKEEIPTPPPEPVRPPIIPDPPKKLETKPTESIVRPIPKEPIRLHIEEKEIVRVTSPDLDISRVTSPTPSLPKERPKNPGAKNICHATRKIRKRLPPPPPPPPGPPPVSIDDPEPIPPEFKVKMEAVIKELNLIRRSEPTTVQNVVTENVTPAPKLVIPVVAADSHYYSDDNTLNTRRKIQREHFIDLDSLDRNVVKQRRFSVACGPELERKQELKRQPSVNLDVNRETLSRSWLDLRKSNDGFTLSTEVSKKPLHKQNLAINEIFINTDPLYDNISKPGPLTIQVRGSPVENSRKFEQFDPDTLDRKPKKEARVEKILLKSGGSFKYKATLESETEKLSPPENVFNRKIGSLRQIYEAKTKAQIEEQKLPKYERRNSLMTYDSDDLASHVRSIKTPDLIRQTEQLKPPVPQKQRRPDISIKLTTASPRRSPEEKERFSHYDRSENTNARRSGRRSNRTRSRRTDLRKLYRTEDSGYLSTDSNESKRRAYYLMQLKPRMTLPEIKQVPNPIVTQNPKVSPHHVESDTDDFESLCDGRSESGGESIETDSVFFGNFDESKQMLAELGFDPSEKIMRQQDQIDSGFVGETNIILSGDSDSEHRSVISIVAGCDGRASSASITNLDDSHYRHTVEC